MEPCSATWLPQAEYESQQGTCRWCKALLSLVLKNCSVLQFAENAECYAILKEEYRDGIEMSLILYRLLLN